MIDGCKQTTNNQFNNTQQIKIQYNILCRRNIEENKFYSTKPKIEEPKKER